MGLPRVQRRAHRMAPRMRRAGRGLYADRNRPGPTPLPLLREDRGAAVHDPTGLVCGPTGHGQAGDVGPTECPSPVQYDVSPGRLFVLKTSCGCPVNVLRLSAPNAILHASGHFQGASETSAETPQANEHARAQRERNALTSSLERSPDTGTLRASQTQTERTEPLRPEREALRSS